MTKIVVELQPELEPTAVGAKAANLGKAVENGFHVPPGFVVTRAALGLFLEDAGLQTQVEEFVSRSVLGDNVERAAEFDALCRQIRAAPIPKPLFDAVARMAEPLLARSVGGVAVRSSGAHEDSAMASFAGIYQSYLGIRSIEALWVAIKQCWCAAWAPQAIAYAKRMGITPEYDSMAVLIQQLVVADSAGVLFTANPRTGNPWQFILESTFGLAQELVGSAGDVPAAHVHGRIMQKAAQPIDQARFFARHPRPLAHNLAQMDAAPLRQPHHQQGHVAQARDPFPGQPVAKLLQYSMI